MLYLGIDQHARQITISLRNEEGDVVQSRQVSTEPERINAFFQHLTREYLSHGESFIAVVEVCGFNDWLIRMLRDYRCHQVILIQPEERKRRKTDRRARARSRSSTTPTWPGRSRIASPTATPTRAPLLRRITPRFPPRTSEIAALLTERFTF